MEPGGHYPSPAEPVPGKNSVVPPALVIAISLGVLTLIGLLVFVLMRVFGGPATVEEVAEDFVVAAYEGQGERVCELTTPAMRQVELDRFEVGNCQEYGEAVAADPQTPDREAADVEILDVDEQGDTAQVRVSTPSGTPGTWTMVGLEQHDDEWLVSDYSG